MWPIHDDVIKWKHFPRNWPFVRGIHRSPVNSPHKGQWRGALMFPLICVWINDWVNNLEAGDLRRYRVHYDVIVMSQYPDNAMLQLYYKFGESMLYPYSVIVLSKSKRSLVRSKIDNGCIVYGWASKTSLAKPHPIYNHGLRLRLPERFALPQLKHRNLS